MKKVILRYGAYAALAELIFFILTWLFIYVTAASHKTQGYIGYVDIICPLLFIYFGTRYYRDCVNGGMLSFMSALKIGLLICIIPAVAFGIIQTVYSTYIEPDFYKTISRYDVEQYRKSLSPAQFAIKLKHIQEQAILFKNPVYNFTMMFLSIYATGIIITLVSALLLNRKAQKVAVKPVVNAISR